MNQDCWFQAKVAQLGILVLQTFCELIEKFAHQQNSLTHVYWISIQVLEHLWVKDGSCFLLCSASSGRSSFGDRYRFSQPSTCDRRHLRLCGRLEDQEIWPGASRIRCMQISASLIFIVMCFRNSRCEWCEFIWIILWNFVHFFAIFD